MASDPRSAVRAFATVSCAVLCVVSAGACRRAHLSRGDAAAVVIVAPRSDAAAPRSLAEHEPNDSPEQAQLLALNAEWPVIDVEGSLSGQADCKDGKDVDVFKVLIPGGNPQDRALPVPDSSQPDDPRRTARRMNLEVTAESGGSVGLQLLDDGLRVLEAVTAEDGQSAGLPNMAAQPGGTYYFRIRAVAKAAKHGETAGQCRYKLSVQLGDFDVADEREPNDSMETAETVTMGGVAELAGFYGWAHDQDWYRVRSPDVASALEVTVDAVDGVTPGLQVLTGGGARLAAAKGRRGEKLGLHNVFVAPAAVDAGAASSFFYVAVRSEAGQNRNQRYVLHLSFGALKQDVESEPNDVPSSATPVGDGTTSAFLPAGDVDCFRYDAREPRELTVEVSFPSRVRGRLEVVRGATKPETITAAETKKARQRILVSGVLTFGQPLLLRIAAAKGDGNANEPYTVRINSKPSTADAQSPQIRIGP